MVPAKVNANSTERLDQVILALFPIQAWVVIQPFLRQLGSIKWSILQVKLQHRYGTVKLISGLVPKKKMERCMPISRTTQESIHSLLNTS